VGPAGAPLLREINSRAVLEALQAAPALTATDLMAATGLSRASTHAVCRDLIGRGWVTELEPTAPASASGLGRPSRTYAFNARASLVVGADLGASTVRVRLCDLSGSVVQAVSRTVSHHVTGPVLLQDLVELVGVLLGRAAVGEREVSAMVVGVPAPVDLATGRVGSNRHVAHLETVDIRAGVRAHYPWPVTVDNDANLAAVGERWQGVAQGSDHAVVLLAGHRMGAGIIVDGRLLRGHGGRAGELGYLRWMDGIGDANGAALVAEELGRDAARAASGLPGSRRGPGSVLLDRAGSPEAVSAEHVMAAAEDGDPTARQIVEVMAERLARTVRSLSDLLDPELVVVGGAISLAGESFLRPVRARLALLTHAPPTLVASALGPDAVVTGALKVALDDATGRLLT
jgi:predicted NBD/HSP70 family sugar kinase